MRESSVLELNDGLLPNLEGNSPLGSNLMKSIVCAKHIEKLLQTSTGSLKERRILRSCASHYLVHLIRRDRRDDDAGSQRSSGGIHEFSNRDIGSRWKIKEETWGLQRYWDAGGAEAISRSRSLTAKK
jgi:hypothetical protein